MPKNSCCSWCGARFADSPWPRTCAGCGETTWLNPLPVAVLLLPVGGGLLLVRRAIPPIGQLALPGGYVNLGESWQEAAARELFEETNIRVLPSEISDFRVRSAPDSTLIVFGLAQPLRAAELPPFVANSEVSERVIASAPRPLAFSLHTEAMAEFFAAAR